MALLPTKLLEDIATTVPLVHSYTTIGSLATAQAPTQLFAALQQALGHLYRNRLVSGGAAVLVDNEQDYIAQEQSTELLLTLLAGLTREGPRFFMELNYGLKWLPPSLEETKLNYKNPLSLAGSLRYFPTRAAVLYGKFAMNQQRMEQRAAQIQQGNYTSLPVAQDSYNLSKLQLRDAITTEVPNPQHYFSKAKELGYPVAEMLLELVSLSNKPIDYHTLTTLVEMLEAEGIASFAQEEVLVGHGPLQAPEQVALPRNLRDTGDLAMLRHLASHLGKNSMLMHKVIMHARPLYFRCDFLGAPMHLVTLHDSGSYFNAAPGVDRQAQVNAIESGNAFFEQYARQAQVTDAASINLYDRIIDTNNYYCCGQLTSFAGGFSLARDNVVRNSIAARLLPVPEFTQQQQQYLEQWHQAGILHADGTLNATGEYNLAGLDLRNLEKRRDIPNAKQYAVQQHFAFYGYRPYLLREDLEFFVHPDFKQDIDQRYRQLPWFKDNHGLLADRIANSYHFASHSVKMKWLTLMILSQLLETASYQADDYRQLVYHYMNDFLLNNQLDDEQAVFDVKKLVRDNFSAWHNYMASPKSELFTHLGKSIVINPEILPVVSRFMRYLEERGRSIPHHVSNMILELADLFLLSRSNASPAYRNYRNLNLEQENLTQKQRQIRTANIDELVDFDEFMAFVNTVFGQRVNFANLSSKSTLQLVDSYAVPDELRHNPVVEMYIRGHKIKVDFSNQLHDDVDYPVASDVAVTLDVAPVMSHLDNAVEPVNINRFVPFMAWYYNRRDQLVEARKKRKLAETAATNNFSHQEFSSDSPRELVGKDYYAVVASPVRQRLNYLTLGDLAMAFLMVIGDATYEVAQYVTVAGNPDKVELTPLAFNMAFLDNYLLAKTYKAQHFITGRAGDAVGVEVGMHLDAQLLDNARQVVELALSQTLGSLSKVLPFLDWTGVELGAYLDKLPTQPWYTSWRGKHWTNYQIPGYRQTYLTGVNQAPPADPVAKYNLTVASRKQS